MSAPHGTPATAHRRDRSRRRARRARARRRGARGRSRPRRTARRARTASRRGTRAPPRPRPPPGAAAGSSPTRTGARPAKRSRSGTLLDHSPASSAPDEDRVGQLERAHERMLDVPAFSARSCSAQRLVDGQVAVDGRRRPPTGARRGRRRRARRPSKVTAPACAQTTSKPVGSGIRHASKASSRSSAGERPEAAVLLRCDGDEHDLAGAAAARSAASACRAAADRALHVDAPAAVTASRPPRCRAHAPRRPSPPATTSTCPHTASASAPAVAVDGHRQAPELVARRLLARVVRMGAQRRQVVAVQVGAQPQRPRRAPRAARARPARSPSGWGPARAPPRRRPAPARRSRRGELGRRLGLLGRLRVQRAARRWSARARRPSPAASMMSVVTAWPAPVARSRRSTPGSA